MGSIRKNVEEDQGEGIGNRKRGGRRVGLREKGGFGGERGRSTFMREREGERKRERERERERGREVSADDRESESCTLVHF